MLDSQKPFMDDPAPQCVNCGGPLPSPHAVCSRCEGEFSSPTGAMGKYRCPSCSCRFDQPGLAWWPPGARWYWPQTQKPQCPHCNSFLRDKKIPAFSFRESAGVAALVIASSFSPWRPGTQIALLVLLVLVEIARWRHATSSVPVEEERYAAEKRGP